MSWRHSLAAGSVELEDPVAKAVLNALAFHANDWSGQAWPSIERLARWTGLSRRSVQNGLRRIEALGLVVTRPGRNQSTSVYELTLPDVRPIDQHSARPAPHGAPPAPPRAPAAPKESVKDHELTLSPEWKPDAELFDWAKEKLDGAADAVVVETDRFVAVNLAKGTEITNVVQAYRAWILRAVQFATRDKTSRRAALAPAPSRLRQRSLRAGKDQPAERDSK